MNKSDLITIELDLKPINPKKQRKHPDAPDFDNNYTIKIIRADGKGVSEEEADLVLQAWLINRNQTRRRKLHPANK